MRASKSPAAMRRVARVSRRTGSAMRSASERPIAAPSSTKNSDARCTPRSRSSISCSISRWRLASGTVRMRSLLADTHRRRGDDVRDGPDLILVHEARKPIEHDRAIDVVRRARGQEARREQVALARREQLGAVEDVDVLLDHLADRDQHVVAARRNLLAVAPPQRVGLLDDALRHGSRARRFRLHGIPQQVGEVRPDDERERQHRHDRREHEREEQLAVEARADLAQQRAADTRALAARSRVKTAVPNSDHHEGHPASVVSSARCTR